MLTEKNKENLKNTCIAVYRTHRIARCKLKSEPAATRQPTQEGTISVKNELRTCPKKMTDRGDNPGRLVESLGGRRDRAWTSSGSLHP